jgi:primosomal protein N'
MCGECRGFSFWCHACESTILLKERNNWEDAYVTCKWCDSGRICKSCQEMGFKYCRWCIVEDDDKEIKTKIESLKKELMQLVEDLELHTDMYCKKIKETEGCSK